MNNKYTHIAVIPARKNSKSLPFKNRFLFKHTAKFLRNNKLFDDVYVNSDDLYMKVQAKKYDFNFYKRKKNLAKDTTCIKEVFVDMKNKLKFSDKPVCIIIGPEGDFSEAEREEILSFSGVQAIKINENILRSETAVISAISIINYVIN